MKKIIVEVGSTNTKIDLYNGKDVTNLKTINIEFKKNYKLENKLCSSDIDVLIKKVNELKDITEDIYVCGTSIFRALSNEEKESFLTQFKKSTNISFNIISQEKENELTVIGAVRKVKEKVAVMIGGGGSTEIAIYEKKIKEMVNSKIGVMDITEKYPDLADDIATTHLEEVKEFISKNMNFPKEKADILILAGGTHKYFALESGISYKKNTLYEDELQPIMMDIETRTIDTKKYYEIISLDEIRKRVEDPKWWYGTRAMCAFVLEVAEKIGAKYIVPTDISMVYGIIKEKF